MDVEEWLALVEGEVADRLLMVYRGLGELHLHCSCRRSVVRGGPIDRRTERPVEPGAGRDLEGKQYDRVPRRLELPVLDNTRRLAAMAGIGRLDAPNHLSQRAGPVCCTGIMQPRRASWAGKLRPGGRLADCPLSTGAN